MARNTREEEAIRTNQVRPVLTARKRIAALALLVVALGVLLATLNFIVTDSRQVPDFAEFYAAAEIVHRGFASQLYNVGLQGRIERKFLNHAIFFPLDHPPFEAWLCLPLALFPFRQAYLLWAAFNLLVLGTVFYFLPRTGYQLSPNSRLVWLAASLPIVAGSLVLGQDTLLLALVFLFAFLALKKHRDFLAGLALGAGLYRFEILLPFAFVFLLRRRWRLLTGFAASAALVFLASLALVGWQGLATYIRVLVQVAKPTGSAANGISAAAMPSLRGALAAFSNGAIHSGWLFALSLAGTFLLLGWAAWEFRDIAQPQNPRFDLQFSFAVIAALLGSYHIFAHELTPLIIVAFLILHHEDVTDRARSVFTRPGAALLLLFFLVMAISAIAGFRQFSVLFVVLLGLMAWLSLENLGSRNAACRH